MTVSEGRERVRRYGASPLDQPIVERGAAPEPDGRLPRAALSPIEWLLLLGPFAVGVLLAFAATPDDVLITARYAANVLDGHGPVFNPGERVEGFTSPLHLLLVVGLQLLPGGFLLAKAKATSIIFGLLAVWTGARVLRASGCATVPFRVGLVLVGANPMIVWAAVSGMETSLACFLLSLLLLMLVAGLQISRWLVAGLVAGAVALTRPEAVLVVAGLVLVSALVAQPSRAWLRLRWGVVAAGMVAVSEMGRLAFFGAVLPNTFYAKEVGKTLGTLKEGLYYVASALTLRVQGQALVVLLGLLVVAVLGLGTVEILRHRPALVYLPVACALTVAFAVAQGGDWMPVGRFLAPAATAFVAIEVVALDRFLARTSPSRLRSGASAVAAVGAIAVLVVPVAARYADSNPAWRTGWKLDDRSLLVNGLDLAPMWAIGSDMLSCAPAGEQVGYTEMGLAGIEHPELRFIDGRGLVDREIATSAPARIKSRWGVYDNDWRDPSSPVGRVYAQRQPALIVSVDGPPEHEALGGRYVLARVEPVGKVDVMLYRRRDVTCPA